MFTIDTITLVAFFGTFQALLFAAIFWFRNNNISNRLFSLLLLATSIRIAKNIFVHLRELNPDLFTSYDFWRTSVYIGISHQFAIGPLFLLYFLAKLKPDFKWKQIYLWHFVPYAALTIISPFLRWNFWANGGLWLSYISILTYYLLALWFFRKHQSVIDKGTTQWLKGLLIVVGVLLVSYSPALFHYLGYVGGAFLYAIATIVIAYIMLSGKSKVSFFTAKYESSPLSKSKARKIKEELEQLMQTGKPFIDPELSMQSLADQLNIRPHQLSRVINQELNMTFSEYINKFRLQEIAGKLSNPEFSHYKISALAYDSGFNSVPTLNTLFKKVYKKTPSQFRKDKLKI